MMLQVFITVLILLFIFYVLHLVRTDKVSLKDTISWLVISVVIVPSVWFPNLLEIITHFLGFQVSSNLVLFISVCVLVFLNFSLTKTGSQQQKQIRRLTQRLALLDKKYEED